jgi:hypothetical protein
MGRVHGDAVVQAQHRNASVEDGVRIAPKDYLPFCVSIDPLPNGGVDVYVEAFDGTRIAECFTNCAFDRPDAMRHAQMFAASHVTLAACKVALAALQGESQLDRANAIKALRDAIAKAES